MQVGVVHGKIVTLPLAWLTLQFYSELGNISGAGMVGIIFHMRYLRKRECVFLYCIFLLECARMDERQQGPCTFPPSKWPYSLNNTYFEKLRAAFKNPIIF